MAKDSAELEGTQGSQPEGSDDNAGQRGSVAADELAAQFSKLQSQFDALSRQIQSNKDRAVKQTNQRLDVLEGSMREILQSAVREGRGVGDLLRDIEEAEERETRQLIQDMARSFRESKLPNPGEGQSQGNGVNVADVLSELELDPEDTRVQAFRAQKFGSKEEAYREAAKLLRKIQTTQPSDADVAGQVSQARQSQPKQEALMQEYREGSKNLYGRELIRFKQAMRQKGLDIS